MDGQEQGGTISTPNLADLLDAVHELGERGDVDGILDQVVQSACAAGRFGSAVVNVVRPDGTVEVVAATGAGASLVGSSTPVETWHRILAASTRWRSLRYLRHDDDQSVLGDMPSVAPASPSRDPDSGEAWHPDDILLAPLVDDGGVLLGALSVDEPLDGRWPGPEQRTVLELFAARAALALTAARAGAGDRADGGSAPSPSS